MYQLQCFMLIPRHQCSMQDPAVYESIETGLVFLGLAGLQDPPRAEVPVAIKDCQNAGIRVIVITGAQSTKQHAAVSCTCGTVRLVLLAAQATAICTSSRRQLSILIAGLNAC